MIIVIVCNTISGCDFWLFMHMCTACGLLVVQNKTLCSHELFSSCFLNNPDLADPKSQQLLISLLNTNKNFINDILISLLEVNFDYFGIWFLTGV